MSNFARKLVVLAAVTLLAAACVSQPPQPRQPRVQKQPQQSGQAASRQHKSEKRSQQAGKNRGAKSAREAKGDRNPKSRRSPTAKAPMSQSDKQAGQKAGQRTTKQAGGAGQGSRNRASTNAGRGQTTGARKAGTARSHAAGGNQTTQSAPVTRTPGTGGGPTRSERRQALGRTLERSLNKFDKRIRREKTQVSVIEEPARSGAGGGPAAIGTGGGLGQESGRSGAQIPPPPGGMVGASSGKAPANADKGGVGSGDQADVAQNIPENIPSGEDDDIVAKQLREAAMNAKDPELRKKLWEEYREYKASH